MKTYRIFTVVIAAAGPSLRSGQYLTWVAPSLWRSRRSRSGDRGFMVEVVRRAGSCGACSETGRTTPARRSWRQSWLLLRLVGRRRPERLDGIARSVAARELSAPDSRWLIRFWRVAEEGTRALRASAAQPLVYRAADVRTRDEDCIRHLGRLFRRSGPARCEFARGQTTGPRPGGRLTIGPDTSELACRT